MTKEDVEKESINYAKENSWYPGETSYESDIIAMEDSFANAFKAGARWRINSVWRKDIQKGKSKKPILVKFDNGLFNLFEDIRDLKGIEDKVSIFAYIEDLLPNKENTK